MFPKLLRVSDRRALSSEAQKKRQSVALRRTIWSETREEKLSPENNLKVRDEEMEDNSTNGEPRSETPERLLKFKDSALLEVKPPRDNNF